MSKKLPATSERLIRDVAANASIRWFDQFETVNGFAQLKRAGYADRDGVKIKLTDAGRAYCAANGISCPEPVKGGLYLKVGQMWEVGGKLYEITDMDGPDKCYPIIMPEVARVPRINQEIEQRAKAIGAPLNAHLLTTLKPLGMRQERAWFERPDVKPWTGSLAEWKRLHGT